MASNPIGVSTVRVEKVRVDYSNRTVLNITNLELRPGITGVLGLNGAGKTTLLDVIAGFRGADQGEVLHDHGVTRVSYLPQSAPLPSRVKVVDLLAEVLWLRRWNTRDIPSRVQAILAEWELEEHAKRRVSALSGGTRQRLAFAAATAANPDVLLLDEPTVGLDAENRRLVESLISSQRERTTVITSHIASDIESVCDRVILLVQGELAFDGSVDELIQASGESTIDDAIITLTRNR